MPVKTLGAVHVLGREVVVFPHGNVSLGLVKADDSNRDGSVLGVKSGPDLALKCCVKGGGEIGKDLLEGSRLL
jgi:hypothetical protein